MYIFLYWFMELTWNKLFNEDVLSMQSVGQFVFRKPGLSEHSLGYAVYFSNVKVILYSC